MKRMLLLLLFVAAVASPSGTTLAQPPPHPSALTIVLDNNYPPYVFRDTAGNLQGILPDQWALWQEKTGVKVHLKAMDWDEAKAYMQAGHADVIDTIFKTPEREGLYAFTRPYAQIAVPVFSHKSLGNITNVASLQGFTVGVKSGDAVIEKLKAEGINSLKEYPNYEAIIQAAKNDEIRVFSVDQPPAIYYLFKYDLAREFRQSFVVYTGEFHRAVQKNEPAILNLVQGGFDKVTPGEYRAINQQWMGTPFQFQATLREWLPLLMVCASIVALLAILNLILRKQVHARTAELRNTLEELRQSLAAREKSENELRLSHEYFATVFDSINDALLILEAPSGRLLDVNQRACEMCGYSHDEILAMGVDPLCAGTPPYAMEDVARWILRIYTEGPQIFEFLAKHRDGHFVWVEVNGHRVQIGANDRLVVTVRDINERKKSEEEHLRYERQLQETQKLESLGLLAGGVAHDFNNLLAAILGNIELALMSIPESSTAREDILAAITATKRAAELVQQMLAYAGKGRFLVEPVDVSAITRETVQLLHTSVSKNAQVNLHLAPEIPPIEADATQLRQVVMNLVINASESLRDGTGTIDVSTGIVAQVNPASTHLFPGEPAAPGPYVYVEVADTGSGMAPETLDKIFDPFYSTKFIGRGLGLPVVLGIMRGHKGAIQVDSTLGKGTTFRVLFPTTPPPPIQDLPEPKAAPVEWNGAGRLLLLVDDDQAILETGVKLLTRMGFRVLCAVDGQHAIHLFHAQASRIAGVILDLTMPHLDGDQTLAELRRIRPDITVIVSSGHGEQEVMQRFAGLEPDGFLQKPYTLEGLRNTLGHLLPS
jgi:two-component system, cell cycle sensor histidine kinase and response regulator CckA